MRLSLWGAPALLALFVQGASLADRLRIPESALPKGCVAAKSMPFAELSVMGGLLHILDPASAPGLETIHDSLALHRELERIGREVRVGLMTAYGDSTAGQESATLVYGLLLDAPVTAARVARMRGFPGRTVLVKDSLLVVLLQYDLATKPVCRERIREYLSRRLGL